MVNNDTLQRVVIINNTSLATGPQIVFPSFRPISLFEIEDDFDNLVSEIENNYQSTNVAKDIVAFIGAFKESLEDKTADALIDYFTFNFGGNMDPAQITELFFALDSFIEGATDEERLMN